MAKQLGSSASPYAPSTGQGGGMSNSNGGQPNFGGPTGLGDSSHMMTNFGYQMAHGQNQQNPQPQMGATPAPPQNYAQGQGSPGGYGAPPPPSPMQPMPQRDFENPYMATSYGRNYGDWQ